MGIIRFFAKLNGIYYWLPSSHEKGFVEDIKETLTEDFPLTAIPYQMGKKNGKYEGKKDGYQEASYEYEKKLIAQANAFLKQEKDFKKEKQAYEKLLDDYEKVISYYENKQKTNEENQLLEKLKAEDKKLKNLKK